MKKKLKMTHEEILESDAVRHIRKVLEENKLVYDCTSFWYPRCIELFNVYQKLIDEHPEDLDRMSKEDWMIAFARHAFYYAFFAQR